MPVVRVNGVELAYQIDGDAGPLLVLTHGSWGDRSGWAAVVPDLAQAFRVVTWDRRGHGDSSDGSHPGTRTQDSDDLAALIDALEIAPAHLVGNSFGGSISLGMALRRPELIASIAVHEPPVFDVLTGADADHARTVRDRIQQVTDVLEAGDLEGGATLFADSVVGRSGSWASYSPEARAMMVRHASTFLEENRDPGVFALDLDGLSQFERPVLLSYGDASPAYFGGAIRRVREVLPDGRVHVVPGAGHVPHRSHPAAYVQLVKAFVQAASDPTALTPDR